MHSRSNEHRRKWIRFGIFSLFAAGMASSANAQLIDRTLAPNVANEGVAKSFAQEIGAGRGNVNTPDSSLFIIARDPARAVRRGRQLFQRKFGISQGLGPRTGDGSGNINSDISIGAGV
jgi:hypothetical protein